MKLYFNPRGISVGALSESKILKMSGHVRKPLRLGTYCALTSINRGAPKALELRKGKRGGRGGKGGGTRGVHVTRGACPHQTPLTGPCATAT
jgi:hypothetical protein